ncbi:MAG: 3-deoxy-8-phosphooctulonate synthase [Flavobacteriales bacterium]|nr:3-deoxy-8-phosphooctulonate synthase [Flavobacteriaceae bacterium]PHX91451.1 MAG: 3-deoxy-8-phosphooctulonate synthase [Flavobacteriales bacterium]
MIPAIPKIKVANTDHFFVIAGPCAIEGRDIAFEIAEQLVRICDRLQLPLIFKGSYRKANRSRLDSFTGIGDEKALRILQEIGLHFDIPTLTDIHEADEAAMAAEYIDVLQIPAFLFRQTDLLVAAAKTGKWINIKKGQFAGSDAMKHAIQKCIDSGNNRLLLTERGNMFGYGDIVVDYRNIPAMQETQCPVVMDITHSLQQPNQASGVTGGKPQLIETIAKAAIAVGCDGLFIETHPRLEEAKSDAANMLPLHQFEDLMQKLLRIRQSIL